MSFHSQTSTSRAARSKCHGFLRDLFSAFFLCVLFNTLDGSVAAVTVRSEKQFQTPYVAVLATDSCKAAIPEDRAYVVAPVSGFGEGYFQQHADDWIKLISFHDPEADIVFVISPAKLDQTLLDFVSRHQVAGKQVKIILSDPPFTKEDFKPSHLEIIGSSSNCCGWEEFNSLGVWGLTQYSAVLLMELDTRLMHPVPELFRCIAEGYDFLGASGIWSPLNGGVLALRPSKEVLQNMKLALKSVNYSTRSGYDNTGFPLPHKPGTRSGFAYETNQGFLHWFFLRRSLEGKNVAFRKAALVDMCVYNFQKVANIDEMATQWCVSPGSNPQERAKILHKYAGFHELVRNRVQEAEVPRRAVLETQDGTFSSGLVPSTPSSDFAPPARRPDPQKENLKTLRPVASLQRALDMYEHAYESEKLHQKQRFLGVRFGQDPPDALVIQEVLFDIKPDVIIETGTNSGGSALYMSFLMEAINPDCKIITLDLQPLNYWHEKWHQAVDPRDSLYWKKRVTQIVGDSVSPEIADQVHKMVGNAPKVLVSLDSHHAYSHVVKEIELYSPLVTVGSYMIVQDTKLGEPMQAANEFVAKQNGAWENDERREYLIFTQHRNGWLRRLR